MKPGRHRLLAAILLVVSFGLLGSLVYSPYEITRLRNSLITQAGEPGDFNWLPGNPPRDYSVETAEPPPPIASAVAAQGFDRTDVSEFQRALQIARHMNGDDRATGGAIQSNLTDAYQRIVNKNQGYCSDFTQVFNGLAMAANIPVREWGMSFDGFSGEGHAFSEVYDSALAKWVFLDSFYSFYVVDPVSRIPLSVLELRERLEANDTTLADGVVPIDYATFAFKKSGERAMKYYQEGVQQYFLWFGTDVYSYDDNPLVGAASKLGRSAEQAVAILLGEHPKIHVYQVEGTDGWMEKLVRARRLFWVAFVLGVVAVAVLARGWIVRRRKS